MYKKNVQINGQDYQYYSLKALNQERFLKKIPFSLKVLLENILRFSHKNKKFEEQLKQFLNFYDPSFKAFEVLFHPARVLMQDFTGVPAVVDLAAMRDACITRRIDPQKVNPLIPVDLVIDHSVMVDSYGNKNAFQENVALEYKRNSERYQFLKWGQKAFKNFRVVPPGMGICHQVNLEYLGQTIFYNKEDNLLYPDTLVGTDSHTTMINALSVLGWGVGGIEAEAAMLGQPVSMLIPDVVGVRLKGKLTEGITATDLVLRVTEVLREKGVVGKFVEYCGDGLDHLSLADRATIANMAPEYGATCGFFPIDDETLKYLESTGRSAEQIEVIKRYAKEQFLWREKGEEPTFKDFVEIDCDALEPSLAGPKRPQDRINLGDVKQVSLSLDKNLTEYVVKGKGYSIKNHDVVLAAITSCTNTSNPSVMIAAGLLAKNACVFGLSLKPWVKTSMAPGSAVVVDYLKRADLLQYLEQLGFHVVGFGCTTCIGNSGPLDHEIGRVIDDNNLSVAGVLSGNRNFEGRIHPQIKENYLASPPLVVAYALAGNMLIDMKQEPLGLSKDGNPVFLKDIWPTQNEIYNNINKFLSTEDFITRYNTIFDGDDFWKNLDVSISDAYKWQESSTYVKRPTFFDDGVAGHKKDDDFSIKNARILALLGDSVTTDHISPAGNIKKDSPAGRYLSELNVGVEDFNSYGSRRGNHEVMMRGTFANIRLKNEMVPELFGGYTIDQFSGEETTIYDAALSAKEKNIDLVVIAGKEYGAGSSRDWAAKGTKLLGVKAVIAESFERIHRSNLIGMGVLPLKFCGDDRKSLGLLGNEIIDIDIPKMLKPHQKIFLEINFKSGKKKCVNVDCCINTYDELAYYKQGGILNYVLEKLGGS